MEKLSVLLDEVSCLNFEREAAQAALNQLPADDEARVPLSLLLAEQGSAVVGAIRQATLAAQRLQAAARLLAAGAVAPGADCAPTRPAPLTWKARPSYRLAHST